MSAADRGDGDRRTRRHTRHPVELPTTIVDDRGETAGQFLFDTGDLSVGGAFLRSTLLFEIDEELGFELQLPAGGSLRVRGKVVRVATDPPGMGIAFLDLGEADRDVIRRLLAEKARGGA